MTRFETLDVWKRSAALCSGIYIALDDLRDFGFQETANFLNYAKGSAGELRSHIYVGMKIGYISKTKGKFWIKESRKISKMIFSLEESVISNPKNGNA